MSHESYHIPLPWLHGWWSENKVPTHSGSRTHSATELSTSGCRVKCEPGRECYSCIEGSVKLRVERQPHTVLCIIILLYYYVITSADGGGAVTGAAVQLPKQIIM